MDALMDSMLHDKAHVGGVSEACKYCDHEQCRAPGCSCDCHVPKAKEEASIIEAEPKLEKACPQCGSKQPAKENYCRIDGHRLASLLCAICGKGMNPEDGYCWYCGAPKGTVDVVKVPQVVTVPQQEIDYAKQVLHGVQRELEGDGGDNGQPVDEGQRVVDQPSGPGGSFRLVSAPNPNKVRTPSPKGGIRLPVKPG